MITAIQSDSSLKLCKLHKQAIINWNNKSYNIMGKYVNKLKQIMSTSISKLTHISTNISDIISWTLNPIHNTFLHQQTPQQRLFRHGRLHFAYNYFVYQQNVNKGYSYIEYLTGNIHQTSYHGLSTLSITPSSTNKHHSRGCSDRGGFILHKIILYINKISTKSITT